MVDSYFEGALAILVVVIGFLIIGWNPIVYHQSPDSTTVAIVLPPVTMVLGRYFGKRDVSSGIDKATNGMMSAAVKMAQLNQGDKGESSTKV